jgi:hypothetical protein
MKAAKLQWLQDPHEVNKDTESDVWRVVSRHFRKKQREYLKDAIKEIVSNRKNENIRELYRDTNEFKENYQTTANLVKDDMGHRLADPHKICNKWKK